MGEKIIKRVLREAVTGSSLHAIKIIAVPSWRMDVAAEGLLGRYYGGPGSRSCWPRARVGTAQTAQVRRGSHRTDGTSR